MNLLSRQIQIVKQNHSEKLPPLKSIQNKYLNDFSHDAYVAVQLIMTKMIKEMNGSCIASQK